MTLTPAAQFAQYKPILFAVAYKMTKSVADTEDVLQDVFISMAGQTATDIRNPESYWVKAVMNRCLNLLKKQQHFIYPGIDLPEPLFHEPAHPVLRQDVSYALVILLQKLNPAERAVFILRETLDYDYDEIANILSLEEDNCRQLLHRAKKKIVTGKTRQAPSPETSRQFIDTFLQTCASGDVQQLMNYLKEDITVYSDGGGKVSAARQPIYGRDNCIAFLTGLYKKSGGQLSYNIVPINGENGMVLYDELTGQAMTVIVFDITADIISNIYFIRNPDKIRHYPTRAI